MKEGVRGEPGVPRRLVERKRLATGETLLGSVPVGDLVLADAPAEEHLLVTPHRREIEQPAIEVLDQHAVRLNFLDEPCDLGRLALERLVHVDELLGLEATSVSCDLPGQLGARFRRDRQGLPARDQLLGHRPKLLEQLVRLGWSEDPRSHAAIISIAVSAGQRVRQAREARRELRPTFASNPAPVIFAWSRAAVWAAAVFALLALPRNSDPRVNYWDRFHNTHDLGYLSDVWARWDSVFFLQVAKHGYDHTVAATKAFFPLYPATVGALGRAFFGHYVLAGVVVSLACSLGAFLLLYRLAEARMGADGAQRAVLYLAVFPMSLFLQAVYSESLYLLLVLAAFVFAERGQFARAGLIAGLALLTRSTAVALLPALALLAWRSPRRRRAFAWLGLAPALFAIYPLILWLQVGDALAFQDAEGLWRRHLSPFGPLGGLWDGLRAGWAGIEQLVSGSHTHAYWTAVSGIDPMRAAVENLQGLAFLLLFIALTVVAWRRFGAPYGLFAACSLALPLSVPSKWWPLQSMPRFGLVVFPFFLALASLGGGRPRLHAAIVAVSALLLGVAVVQWALWQWVA